MICIIAGIFKASPAYWPKTLGKIRARIAKTSYDLSDPLRSPPSNGACVGITFHPCLEMHGLIPPRMHCVAACKLTLMGYSEAARHNNILEPTCQVLTTSTDIAYNGSPKLISASRDELQHCLLGFSAD